MEKLPPIEKIPEAYTAIVDGRVRIQGDTACVVSSNGAKEYIIKWSGNIYYSNDSSTYWQGYAGYPIIAVLMIQGKISLNESILHFFKNINWNKLNKENKRNYSLSLEKALKDVCENDKKTIQTEMLKVLDEIQNLDITLTRKKL